MQYAQVVTDPDPNEAEVPKFLHIISANLDRDPRPAELESWPKFHSWTAAAAEVSSVRVDVASELFSPLVAR